MNLSRHTKRRLTAAMIASLSLAALPSPGHAQPQPVNEARAAFQDGVRQYAEHHYAEALESFRRAYRVRPHPSVLVNIANCHMALNQPQQAVTLFERYLSDPSNTLSTEQRLEIQHGLEEAQRQLAQVTVHVVPAGAEVFLDGDLIGVAPLRRAIATGPGPHVIEARLSGTASQQHQARLAPGGQLTVTLDLNAARSYLGAPAVSAVAVVAPPPPQSVVVAPPPPPQPVVVAPPPVRPPQPQTVAVEIPRQTEAPSDVPERRGMPGAFWAGLTLTLAAGGTAVGFVIYAETLAQEYNDLVRQRDATTDPTQRAYLRENALAYADAVESNRQVAMILGGIGGVALIFTAIAPVAFGRSTPRRSGPVQALRVAPTLGGLSLSGTF